MITPETRRQNLTRVQTRDGALSADSTCRSRTRTLRTKYRDSAHRFEQASYTLQGNGTASEFKGLLWSQAWTPGTTQRRHRSPPILWSILWDAGPLLLQCCTQYAPAVCIAANIHADARFRQALHRTQAPAPCTVNNNHTRARLCTPSTDLTLSASAPRVFLTSSKAWWVSNRSAVAFSRCFSSTTWLSPAASAA
jgi:hypothetical protein